jgi:hypothetical protein
MKTLASLFLGLVLAAGAAADEASLDLSKPPTFGEMTKTGMKFPIPNWLGELARVARSDRPSQAGNPPGLNRGPRTLEMEAEPLTFALRQGDRNGESITWKSVQCRFSPAEQVDPGKHYPPKLPITDTSHISSITLTAAGDPAVLLKQAAATVKVLGITDPKLETWVASELWKNAPNFQNAYEDQVPRVRLYLGVDQREGPVPQGSFQITIDWNPEGQN